jgi:hypothetical protein
MPSWTDPGTEPGLPGIIRGKSALDARIDPVHDETESPALMETPDIPPEVLFHKLDAVRDSLYVVRDGLKGFVVAQ